MSVQADFLADMSFFGCLVKAKLRSLETAESTNACFVSVSWRPFVTDRRQNVGHCGQWDAAPPTAAMGRSPVVGWKIVSNDRLALPAISGPDPEDRTKSWSV